MTKIIIPVVILQKLFFEKVESIVNQLFINEKINREKYEIFDSWKGSEGKSTAVAYRLIGYKIGPIAPDAK